MVTITAGHHRQHSAGYATSRAAAGHQRRSSAGSSRPSTSSKPTRPRKDQHAYASTFMPAAVVADLYTTAHAPRPPSSHQHRPATSPAVNVHAKHQYTPTVADDDDIIVTLGIQLGEATRRAQSSHGHRSSSSSKKGSEKHRADAIRQSFLTVNAVTHYSVGSTLGEGTFGQVRRGVHKLTGMSVAIKILEKDRISDMSDIERVKREIRILARLQHPNVIRLYEVIDSPKHIFLIMEYANGGELFDYIVQCGRVEEQRACQILHHIINGIDSCHAAGVIHRDLKPENLLMMKDNSIRIVDFGLGTILPTPQHLLSTACGSPCYAAPEMIRGYRYVGSAVDCWSLGVILYALLCGYLPFEDSNTSKLYEKIMNGEYSIPSHVSSGARDLITRLLEVEPQRRYTCEMVRQHPWYTQCSVPTDMHPASRRHTSARQPQQVLQEGVLQHMAELGYDRELVIESVQKRRYNHYAATYELLSLQPNRTSHDSYPPSKRATANPSSISVHDASDESLQPLLPDGLKTLNIEVLQLEKDADVVKSKDEFPAPSNAQPTVTYMPDRLSRDSIISDTASQSNEPRRSERELLQQQQQQTAQSHTHDNIISQAPPATMIRPRPPSAALPTPAAAYQLPQPPVTYHTQQPARPPTGSYPLRPAYNNVTARAASAYFSGRVQSQYAAHAPVSPPHVTAGHNMAAQLQMAFVISRPPTQQMYRIPIQQPIKTATHQSPYAPHPPTITPVIGTTSRPNTARKPPVPKFKRKGKANGRSNTVENIYVRPNDNTHLNQWMVDVPMSAGGYDDGGTTTRAPPASAHGKARVSSATYRPPTSYQLHTRQPLATNGDPNRWMAQPIAGRS